VRCQTGAPLDRLPRFYYCACHVRVHTQAPAKVNLHLQILDVREDGYHNLVSLFQAVSLYDDVELATGGQDGSVSIAGDFPFPQESNTIHRAATLFRDKAGVRDGLRVRVHKRIPMGGGMGGGSCDAAATLLGLQELFGRPLSDRRLLSLGAELGSDVPFFLRGSAAAIVEGRGERVTPIAPRDDFGLVCLFPGIPVHTVDAYRMLDEMRRSVPSGAQAASRDSIGSEYMLPVEQWSFRNDFDDVVQRPEILRGRDMLLARGALACRLTGSGSTLIGLFATPGDADECIRRLPAGPSFPGAIVVKPLAMMPLVG